MNPTPKTIQIFLPGGDPQGIRVAEITTWNSGSHAPAWEQILTLRRHVLPDERVSRSI